jgi:hypothetical protein
MTNLETRNLKLETVLWFLARGTELGESLFFDAAAILENSVNNFYTVPIVASNGAGDIEFEKGADELPLPCFVRPNFEVVPAHKYSVAGGQWPVASERVGVAMAGKRQRYSSSSTC